VSWGLVKLGDIAPSKPLKNPVIIDESNTWQLNLDMIESQSGRIIKKQKGHISKAGTSTHWFDSRHVLYSKLRPYLNKVVLPDEQGLATTELVPMLPDAERLDRNYLMHYLRSKQFVNWITDQVAGAKMPRVSMTVFWSHQIPLPYIDDPEKSLLEQKRIAAILDKADAIRRKRQQAINLADDFLRSVFLDMFGDPVTNPKGWDSKTIEQLADKEKYSIKAGPFGSALKKADYVPGGYKIYGQEQVIKDNINFGDYYIDEHKYNSLKSCAVSSGDMLISLVGSFGKILVVPTAFEPGIINPRLMKVKFDEQLTSPLFMKFMLTTKEMLRKIESMAHGGTMGILNVGKVKSLEVIAPPLKEQKRFMKILDAVSNSKAKFNVAVEEPLFESLSQKAFVGEL
jgi:type I restriction enzyme S subunit